MCEASKNDGEAGPVRHNDGFGGPRERRLAEDDEKCDVDGRAYRNDCRIDEVGLGVMLVAGVNPLGNNQVQDR